MKKIIYLLAIVVSIVSCKQEAKDYVTISGKITNQNTDSLAIIKRSKVIKKIDVDENGVFKDTFKIEKAGKYYLEDGKEYAIVYLKNGFDINVTIDTKAFDETIAYSGIGADVNNYLAKRSLIRQKMRDPELMDLEKNAFDEKINGITSSLYALMDTTQDLDSFFIASEKTGIENEKRRAVMAYEKEQVVKIIKGKDSPKFVDYENFAGGSTSLDDFKGKYVYIDLWATWCGPCLRQIPFLKEVEKAYHHKNIAFVSISVDKPKDYEKWKKMVKEKELTGVQLYAKGDRQFREAYKASGIPRFILIDPQGKVVSADAPRPSDPKLRDLLNVSLLKTF